MNSAVINLAAMQLIEYVTAGNYDQQAAHRHRFRAEEMLKKIADELGFKVERREAA